MDYDKTKMPGSYDAGRGYSPATLALWLGIIGRAAPQGVSRILDLGCGTGRFSRPLAEHFDADVIAVDPSAAMLEQARLKPSSHVRYEQAAGENLPLADASVDMVFLSMVFHHFRDRDRVIAECRRVLRNSGCVAMRAGTTDRTDCNVYFPFFPEAPAIARGMQQSIAEIETCFRRGGFTLVQHEVVQHPMAANWSDFAERLSHRADSILVQLKDESFAGGMARLRAHAATRPPDEPVVEPIDFFVFRLTGAD
jgi:ubiquinone/menaquinone biosynthesis C-methylase UbiE